MCFGSPQIDDTDEMFSSSRNGYFKGRVVIVTGASSGIGREIARAFASLGAKITVAGRNPERLKETADFCRETGASDEDLLEVLGDLSLQETCVAIVNKTIERFGKIDVLVNNAGAHFGDKEGRKGIAIPIDAYDRTMALNVRSPIILSQLCISHLEATQGAVVNISSVASAPLVSPTFTYYSVSKAALDAVTVQMAGTLIAKGIRVNGVNPGIIATNFHDTAGMGYEAAQQMYAAAGKDPELIPIGRMGTARDVAEVVVFLADRTRSEYVIGQRLTVDGGTTLMNKLISADF